MRKLTRHHGFSNLAQDIWNEMRNKSSFRRQLTIVLNFLLLPAWDFIDLRRVADDAWAFAHRCLANTTAKCMWAGPKNSQSVDYSLCFWNAASWKIWASPLKRVNIEALIRSIACYNLAKVDRQSLKARDIWIYRSFEVFSTKQHNIDNHLSIMKPKNWVYQIKIEINYLQNMKKISSGFGYRSVVRYSFFLSWLCS